jgi:hypothetical protein
VDINEAPTSDQLYLAAQVWRKRRITLDAPTVGAKITKSTKKHEEEIRMPSREQRWPDRATRG